MSEKRFLVSARKYRPQLFHELVAQEHVTGTLKNAVRLDRLGQAYLFTGPRGVGKTTAARILAKAINCTTAPDERADHAEPCRVCESCRSFEEGRNLNIFEIDAASHNKVDDVRDLNDKVRIPPQGGRKKVYIVDEVHMMTTQAFNALLKTLEEPPPHVLFIFATTEPHKVLPTIQSRCQRFDFRRIPVGEIMSRLTQICASEEVTADEGSLMLIARKGDGALRDALSVFDQAVSLCGDNLRVQELVDALGVVNEDLYFDVTDHIAAANPGGMLTLVESVVSAGYDLQEFLDGLAEHFRNILVAVTAADAELIEAAEATRKRYSALADKLSETQVMRLLALVDSTMDGLRMARQPRLRLELALLKMATIPSTSDLRSVLSRIDQVVTSSSEGTTNAGLAGAAVPEATSGAHASTLPPVAAVASAPVQASAKEGAAPGPVPDAAPAAATPDSAPVEAPDPVAGPAPDPSQADGDSATGPRDEAPPSDTDAAETALPDTPTETAESDAWPGADEPVVEDDGPPPIPVSPGQTGLFGADAPPTGSLFDAAPEIFGKPALQPKKKTDGDQQASARTTETAVLEAPAELPETDGALAWPEPGVWAAIVEAVCERDIGVGALLGHAVPKPPTGASLVLRVPDDLHRQVLREAGGMLASVISDVARTTIEEIRPIVDDRLIAASGEERKDFDPEKTLRTLCEEYPSVRALVERFGGEIVW